MIDDKITQMKIDELNPYAANPRAHSKKQVEQIAKSIKEFGFTVPILIDEQDTIIAGHGRLEAAKLLEMETVPTLRLEGLTDQQKRAYVIADNKLTIDGEWNAELLHEQIEKLYAEDYDITLTGFDIDIIAEELLEAEEDDFDVDANLSETPQSQEGDLFIFDSTHRLLCGDSTRVEDIERVCGGKTADLLLTDPPYNVDYTGGTKEKLKIENDSMDDASFRAFLTDAFNAAVRNIKPGGAFYIWHADSEGFNFRAAAKAAGMQIRECLIWVKSSIVLGRQDYQWQHEPCLYGWKDGAGHYFTDDRTQSTVIFEKKPTRSADHPTMKPVKLFGRLIKNSTRPGETVLDPFAGSGTAMIAADDLGRKAVMLEKDPRYCDSIIKRYKKHNGSLNGVTIERDGKTEALEEIFIFE